MIWFGVGRAPNVAAKLCSIREPSYHSYIAGEVYDKMNDDAKLWQRQNMWEERNWAAGPISRVFRSSWWVKP